MMYWMLFQGRCMCPYGWRRELWGSLKRTPLWSWLDQELEWPPSGRLYKRELLRANKVKSFYFCDVVPFFLVSSLKSIRNSTVANTFISLLLFRQRSVLRLSLGVQRLLLQVRVGREDEGRTADPLHCLLTGPGHKDTFILSFVLFTLLKKSEHESC